MLDARKLVAVVGPTAAGKSALAVRLASELGGEVVSADSRQVYRYMDIGTAKPTAQQRSAVPHYLLDVADPGEEYSLALFLRQAREAIDGVRARSRLPVVAGGSGQYVWGLLEGWQVPEVPPDPELRRELETRARVEGADALHRELGGLDPAAAGRIDVRNVRRVIRALEVAATSPRPASTGPSRRPPDFEPVIVGLEVEREELNGRIDARVSRMVSEGWVGEVEGLLRRGYGPELPSMSSLGYGEIVRHIGGELSLQDAVETIGVKTRGLARHQRTWFKASDGRIRWFEASPDGQDAAAAWVAREVEAGSGS